MFSVRLVTALPPPAGRGAVFVRAQQRIESLIDLGHQIVFQPLPVFEVFFGRLGIVGRGRFSRPVEQVPARVHHRDRLGREAFDGARGELADRCHVLRSQLRARTQLHQHARLGGLAGVEKQRVFGKRDVYARLFHCGERHHAALQLAFERAMIVDLLGEVTGAEAGLVEQFEPDAAAFGKAGRRHVQAQLGHTRRRHQHRRAVAGEPVLGAAFAHLGHHCRGVFGGERTVQRAEVALPVPVRKPGERGNHGRRCGRDRDDLPPAQALDQFLDLIHW